MASCPRERIDAEESSHTPAISKAIPRELHLESAYDSITHEYPGLKHGTCRSRRVQTMYEIISQMPGFSNCRKGIQGDQNIAGHNIEDTNINKWTHIFHTFQGF